MTFIAQFWDWLSRLSVDLPRDLMNEHSLRETELYCEIDKELKNLRTLCTNDDSSLAFTERRSKGAELRETTYKLRTLIRQLPPEESWSKESQRCDDLYIESLRKNNYRGFILKEQSQLPVC